MMKIICPLLLLFVSTLASASKDEERRQLQVPPPTISDWHVNLVSVATQAYSFETGLGGGNNVNLKISVLNKCRMESPVRTTVGDFYPTSTVPGIYVDDSGIKGPGPGNTISFTFTEGISYNTHIYNQTTPEAATINFCVLTGLYDGTILIDYAEVKLTYNINLVTMIPALTGYTVIQAQEFNNAADTDIDFDGSLGAYFCDPETFETLPDGTTANQGSTFHVCFKIEGGQFELKDVQDFIVKNAVGDEPSQTLVTDFAADPLYAYKECRDGGNNDKNVCLISFMLKADFFDFAALTLAADGNVLLEFGSSGAARRRRQVRRNLRIDNRYYHAHIPTTMQQQQRHLNQDDPVSETVHVPPHRWEIDRSNNKKKVKSSASKTMASLATVGAIAGAALIV